MKTSCTIKDLTEDQKKLLPTPKQVEQYKKTGWHVTDVIIPEHLINAAIKGAEDFYNGVEDFGFNSKNGIADDSKDEKGAIKNNEFVTLRKKELQELGFFPMISATASLLENTDEIRLFADSLVNKLPSNNKVGAVGWHSDKAYWPTCTSNNMLTAWIPLQDCTIDMGPLTHINESSHWKDEKELKKFFSFNNQDLGSFEDYLANHKQGYTKTPMTLKKGQVSFHNCNTIHASYPNTSNKNRLALAIHFQDKSNQYQKAYKDNGELIVIGYDKLCSKDSSGNPDYKDSNLFPLLYTT